MTLAAIIFLSLAAAAAGSDVHSRRVSNRLNVVIVGAGMAFQLVHGGPFSVLLGLAGAATGLGLLVVPFSARWIGAGDVKLMAALGAWLGPVDTVWACLLGLVGGGLLAAAMAVAGSSRLRRSVWTNLVSTALTLSLPEIERRERRLSVPLAVPYAAAAVGVFIVNVGRV